MNRWVEKGLLIALILGLGLVSPALAATCRFINHQTVCILDVKRSAKQDWEYRVTLSLDGVRQPEMIYNCRDRLKTTRNIPPQPFTANDIGDTLCRLLSKS